MRRASARERERESACVCKREREKRGGERERRLPLVTHLAHRLSGGRSAELADAAVRDPERPNVKCSHDLKMLLAAPGLFRLQACSRRRCNGEAIPTTLDESGVSKKCFAAVHRPFGVPM